MILFMYYKFIIIQHAIIDNGFTFGKFQWTFALHHSTAETLVGVTTKPCKKSNFTEPNYTLWNLYNGQLYINGKLQKTIEKAKPGDKITFAYDGTRGNVTIFKNGKQCSEGFSGIRDKIFPCVCFYGPCHEKKPSVEMLSCEQL